MGIFNSSELQSYELSMRIEKAKREEKKIELERLSTLKQIEENRVAKTKMKQKTI